MREVPIMPKEFIGEEMRKTEYVTNTPRKWTEEEINWCLKLKEEGFSNKEIAESVSREYTSVNIKMKRLTKRDNTYNKEHILEKYNSNKEFYDFLKPKTILDVYCGENSYWKKLHGKGVISNDKDKNIEADYNLDSLKLLCKLYYEGAKFDMVDLDPYGSAANCLELAIQMAKKGLIVTLGEMGHKRFKRLDYVRRFYNINTLDDFTSDKLINEIIKTGKKYKKDLIVYKKCDWKGISRVWFKIENIKITEQWND